MELELKELKNIDGQIVQLIPVQISEVKEMRSRSENHIKFLINKIEDMENEIKYHKGKLDIIKDLLLKKGSSYEKK